MGGGKERKMETGREGGGRIGWVMDGGREGMMKGRGIEGSNKGRGKGMDGWTAQCGRFGRVINL